MKLLYGSDRSSSASEAASTQCVPSVDGVPTLRPAEPAIRTILINVRMRTSRLILFDRGKRVRTFTTYRKEHNAYLWSPISNGRTVTRLRQARRLSGNRVHASSACGALAGRRHVAICEDKCKGFASCRTGSGTADSRRHGLGTKRSGGSSDERGADEFVSTRYGQRHSLVGLAHHRACDSRDHLRAYETQEGTSHQDQQHRARR